MEFSIQETLKKVSPALRVTCMLEMSSMINTHPFWQGCSSKLRKQSSYHTQRFPQRLLADWTTYHR
jgi:ribosomal protein L31